MHEDINAITERIIGAAIAVHRELGPGLLEKAYEPCMALELDACSLRFKRQVAAPLRYRGRTVRPAFRMDMVVEDCVVVEIKAVKALAPIFTAQVLTYLKLSGHPVGLILNFNSRVLTQGGIRRLVGGAHREGSHH